MILILDDNKARHDGFKALLPDKEFVHAYTHSEAVLSLTLDKFEALFLDHDLAEGEAKKRADYVQGFNSEGRRYLTGQDFCAALRDELHLCPLKVLIHSWNGWGAENMARILNEFNGNKFKILAQPMPAWAEVPSMFGPADTESAQLSIEVYKKQVEEFLASQ